MEVIVISMKNIKLIVLGMVTLGAVANVTSVEAATTPSKKEVSVSVKEAIKIFQKEYPDTDITSIDLNSSFGKYFYEIESIDDSVEYSAKIDAKSKKISDKEKDRLDADDRGANKRKEEKLDTKDIISVKKASDLAIKEVGKGKATDWKLDRELDTTYWKVTIKNKSKSTEVMIDAKTGDVLSTEIDD